MADASQIEAIRRGDVCIGPVRLAGVLHVPLVGGNLLAVGRPIDYGFDVSFDTKKCMISNQQINLQGKREGNPYQICIPSTPDEANLGLVTNKAKPESIDIWPCRLGHHTRDAPRVQYLQAHVTELTILPIKTPQNITGICETCALGSQHK